MKQKTYNIPIFIPHKGCPHDCVFCNQVKITGVDTDATPRDAYDIIKNSLESLPDDGRIQAAFFGGSFTGLDIKLQEEFLRAAAEFGERLDGVRLSTRPDYINDEIIALLKMYNVKCVELGAQSAFDDVLDANKRGHTFHDTMRAAESIKAAEMELGLQMMVGMYGSTPDKDIITAEKMIALKPGCARIYPTVTLKGTRLEELYSKGEYQPYGMQTAVEITAEILEKFILAHIPVIRIGLHSDEGLLEDGIIAGPYHPAFGELAQGQIWRNKIEKVIVRNNINNDTYFMEASPSEISKIYGHKACNRKYFKDKYGVEIKIK